MDQENLDIIINIGRKFRDILLEIGEMEEETTRLFKEYKSYDQNNPYHEILHDFFLETSLGLASLKGDGSRVLQKISQNVLKYKKIQDRKD